jgi:hypothetical protein
LFQNYKDSSRNLAYGSRTKQPEIGAAITKLEMALNNLAIQTGGVF